MPVPAELAALCETEHPRLVRALHLMVGSHDDAEELAQEALVRLAAAWPRVRRMDAPGGWLYRVAVNLALDAKRKSKREEAALTRVAGRRERDIPELGGDADVEALRAALAALPERQRTALVLRHYLDLSVADTAAALDLSESALRQLCHRGIETLRTDLGVDLQVDKEARYA